ncbi:hypothetical protein N7532_000475 [Penicillium argentinense]|uniref:F-box domain-containing protein n=1 Tax=Penicillium argentinense TaxID=1131581 RepID=A0A9W9G681_9EURO|nr:uncharacterized protein N7532_000475 [Penicillium argentinense]KAJ5112430.1 hypothetical protein N7532_000475 [Penicillium argentinense]
MVPPPGIQSTTPPPLPLPYWGAEFPTSIGPLNWYSQMPQTMMERFSMAITKPGKTAKKKTHIKLPITKESPFKQLPMDCWVHIAGYLSQQDLLSLSQVSKALNSAAEPHLYKRIEFDWYDPPLLRILALLDIIQKRPRLADYVQYASFLSPRVVHVPRRLELYNSGSSQTLKRLYPEVHSFAKRQFRRAGLKLGSRWGEYLRFGHVYAYAAVLVSQFRNLRDLRLDYQFLKNPQFMMWVIEHGRKLAAYPDSRQARNCSISKFHHLKTIDLGSNLTWRYQRGKENVSYGSDSVLSLLDLPNLESMAIFLRGTMLIEITEGIKDDPALVNIRKLAISGTTNRKGASVPTLIRFWTDKEGRPWGWKSHLFCDLLQSFFRLESLNAPASFFLREELVEFDREATQPRLRDALPETLQELWVQVDFGKDTRQFTRFLQLLEAFLENKPREALPNLRRICLWRGVDWIQTVHHTALTSILHVYQLAFAAGIEFGYDVPFNHMGGLLKEL